MATGNGVTANTGVGDVKFVDMNHDGVINDKDKVDLGNGIPKYSFGFNLGCSYKHFDFSATFSGLADFKVANGGYRNWGNSSLSNYTTYFLQRWTGEGTSNKIPRLTNDDHNWTTSPISIWRTATICALPISPLATTSLISSIRSTSVRPVFTSRYRTSIRLPTIAVWILRSASARMHGCQVSIPASIRMHAPLWWA